MATGRMYYYFRILLLEAHRPPKGVLQRHPLEELLRRVHYRLAWPVKASSRGLAKERTAL